MKALEKRLAALEGGRTGALVHLDDDQIARRISELDEQIDSLVGQSIPDWRAMFDRGELNEIIEIAGAAE